MSITNTAESTTEPSSHVQEWLRKSQEHEIKRRLERLQRQNAIIQTHVLGLETIESRPPTETARYLREIRAMIHRQMKHIMAFHRKYTVSSFVLEVEELKKIQFMIQELQEHLATISEVVLAPNRLTAKTSLELIREALKKGPTETVPGNKRIRELIESHKTSVEKTLELSMATGNRSPPRNQWDFAHHSPLKDVSDVREFLLSSSKATSIDTTESVARLVPSGSHASKSSISLDSPCRVAEVLGKGRGLLANRKFRRGDRILAEVPMFKIPAEDSEARLKIAVHEMFERLDNEERTKFLNLKNAFPEKGPVLGIVNTVCLGMGDEDKDPFGIFQTFAFLNNSCRPNAWAVWNPALGKQTLHAQRDIGKDEEITMYYSKELTMFELRQDYHKERSRFECICERCILTVKERDMSDMRIIELMSVLKSVESAFGTNGHPRTGGELLRMLRCALHIISEEGPAAYELLKAYEFAIGITRKLNDRARAYAFAMRRYSALRDLQGDDHPDTKEALNLAKWPFGRFDIKGWLTLRSGLFRRKQYEPLKEASPLQFEDWLWFASEPKYTPYHWERRCYECPARLA